VPRCRRRGPASQEIQVGPALSDQNQRVPQFAPNWLGKLNCRRATSGARKAARPSPAMGRGPPSISPWAVEMVAAAKGGGPRRRLPRRERYSASDHTGGAFPGLAGIWRQPISDW